MYFFIDQSGRGGGAALPGAEFEWEPAAWQRVCDLLPTVSRSNMSVWTVRVHVFSHHGVMRPAAHELFIQHKTQVRNISLQPTHWISTSHWHPHQSHTTKCDWDDPGWLYMFLIRIRESTCVREWSSRFILMRRRRRGGAATWINGVEIKIFLRLHLVTDNIPTHMYARAH